MHDIISKIIAKLQALPSLVSDLVSNISGNTSDIETLQTTVSQNSSDITTLQGYKHIVGTTQSVGVSIGNVASGAAATGQTDITPPVTGAKPIAIPQFTTQTGGRCFLRSVWTSSDTVLNVAVTNDAPNASTDVVAYVYLIWVK